MATYDNLNDLYMDNLDKVYSEYEFFNSPRGNDERECLGFSAKIQNPNRRFCLNKTRKQNIIFNYAESLWYLSGKNDLEFISYYAPSMSKYSVDDISLPGTGYGKKLFSYGECQLNQIDRAVDILKNNDADSKRVFLQIFDANEDIHTRNIDVSCTIGLLLLLRSGELHMTGMMRANDAYVGILSDIFSFTFLQEYVSCLIGASLGSYYHFVGSIHTYESNSRNITKTLNCKEYYNRAIKYPSMPKCTCRDTIKKVLEIESRIRTNEGPVNKDEIKRAFLHPYWEEILFLFQAYKYIIQGENVPEYVLSVLSDIHKRFLITRWPKVVSGDIHNFAV